MAVLEYRTFRDARDHLSTALDRAAAGGMVLVHRKDVVLAVHDASPLRHFLAATIPSGAVIAPDEHGYSVYLPDLPVAADGTTLDQAMDEMTGALRTYAAAWHEVLSRAPNHRDNWGLVQLIDLSTDGQLRDWLNGAT